MMTLANTSAPTERIMSATLLHGGTTITSEAPESHPSPHTDVAASRRGGFVQFARRTFESLSSDQARALLQTRPDPVGSVRRSGQTPYRILCFGDGALRGVGIRDHNLGLPGHIADRIVAQTGRGVQVDVIVDGAPTSAAALGLLGGLRLRRYDAVIVVLGDGAATPMQTDQWRGAIVGLSRVLMTETSHAAGVFVYDSNRALAAANLAGTSSRAAGSSARLTAVTEEVCALTGRVRFSELPLSLGAQDASGKFSDGTYSDWADLIVQRLKPTFTALDDASEHDSPRAYRNRPQDERFRQRALDALRLRKAGRDTTLDRELAAARAMYRSGGAALNLIDGDIQWPMGSAGDGIAPVHRSIAFCNFAIDSDELTLINDTWLDPRSRASPLSQGENGARFYAGFPVHSIDGYRVGMVCIYGTTPRSLRPRELEGLRDVAARVEQHLWNTLLNWPTT
jgi:GAF domain-containing protein